MKRGLKGSRCAARLCCVRCYNHCPDEKGTESSSFNRHESCLGVVTTIAPMKRGLKGGCWFRGGREDRRYNHCPDEKGTESVPIILIIALLVIVSYNHCPDEKGTESSGRTGDDLLDRMLQPLPR